ncbi:TPA: argininosuccinate lyase, partial [Candidatus Bathyarchaeota archaeon]|nr:argininosuccinate lyase [Candidatus Bathyarchaeota archaeon]
YEQGIISKEELRRILKVLEKLKGEAEKGALKIEGGYEDIHEYLEARVVKEEGIEVGGKLHTARSRNDQVALDIRMRARSWLNQVSGSLLDLIEALLALASKEVDTPIILYTHAQHAQIGSFAHYLLAQIDALFRDYERLAECYNRVNLSPLGACAIGGTRLPINRRRTAELLGFDGLVENSVDAVGSRDFELEIAGALAILMSNLTRIVEDLILWSSEEFGFVEIADEYASTSSLMPQKKNPCTLEVLRGKSGEVFGALASLFTILKGIPTGYNRDLQEAKIPLWRCFRAVERSLEILTGVMKTLGLRRERMEEAAKGSYAMAVDLTEALTASGFLSFREAHKLVGELVKEMASKGRRLASLTPKEIEETSRRTLGKAVKVNGKELAAIVDPRRSLNERRSAGSPSPKEVKRMMSKRKIRLSECRRALQDRVNRVNEAIRGLASLAKEYLKE